MTYEIGQIFETTYPPEAAAWCNEKGAFIAEIESVDGVRRFQILAVPEPTPEEIAEQIQQNFTNLIQNFLDSKAQELNYDSCLSVCSYVDTGVAKFDAEGKAFRSWRSAVWAKGYEILARVQSGQREIPTEEELFAELPELVIEYTDNVGA